MEVLDLQWWVYLFMALSVFSVCLIINYIVKKVNEAKMEERFIRMRNKSSRTQYTQVQRPYMETEIQRGVKNPSDKTNNHGISLVFNYEENMKDRRTKSQELSITSVLDQRTSNLQSLNVNVVASHVKEPAPKILSDHNSLKNNDSGRLSYKKSFLGISLKESKNTGSIKKINEEGSNSLFKSAVEYITSKITFVNSTEECQTSEKSLEDWIKDLLMPLVPDDIFKVPNTGSEKQ